MRHQRAFLYIFSLLACFCAAFTVFEGVFSPRRNTSFQRGEVLEFKMTYGIFTIGRGSARIDNNYYKLNNRYCYKVSVFGETVGLVSWVASVDDQFGAFIDTSALIPHQFYRKIREGHYKKDEWTEFDHEKGKIVVKTLDNKTGTLKEPKTYEFSPETRVWDMIGGFLYFRTIDFSRVAYGDTLTVRAFFEDEFYNLRVVYRGKDVISTKAGKFRAIVLKPIMPDNKLFDGEDSITIWFSDDKNCMPLKIKAEMFIGSAGVELTGYSGLRNPTSKVDD